MSGAGGPSIQGGAQPPRSIEDIAKDIIAKDAAEHPTSGRPGKLGEPRRRWISRRAAIAAAVALLIGVIGGGLLWNNRRSSTGTSSDPVKRLTTSKNLSTAPRVITGTGVGQRVRLDRTFQWKGWTISIGDLYIKQAEDKSFTVAADATFTNDGRWWDGDHPKRTPDMGPTRDGPFALKLGDKDFFNAGGTGVETPYGATTPVTLLWPAPSLDLPDLSHAVLTVGGGGIQTVVMAVDGKGFDPLAPKSFSITGVADTGPDTTAASFADGELRADMEDQEAPTGSLYVVVGYSVTFGKQYTNGATAYWDQGALHLKTPGGTDGVQTCCDPHFRPPPGTIAYQVPRPEQGTYTITNTYVGCCGTKKGSVAFVVPSM